MAQAIEFRLDTQDVVAGANRAAQAVDAFNLSLNDTTKVVEKFNTNGDLTAATITRQVSAFERLKTTITGIDTGAQEIVHSFESIGKQSASNITTTQQLDNAVRSLTAQFKALDPAITSVAVKSAKFGQDGRLVSGNLEAIGSSLGKVSGQFEAHTGSIVATGFAYDQVKEKTVKVAAATKGELTPALDEIKEQAGNLGSVLNRLQRSFQYFVAYKAFNFITEQLKEGITTARDFQIQISLIRTLSQDAQQSFGKFGQDVRNVSDKSGINVNDVGKAFYDVASNQVAKGSAISPFVQQATDFARVTGSTLPDSVNLLSSAINSYGLSASDAQKVSAQLFRTIDEGRVVASEIAGTFGRVGVVAHQLGVSLEDVEATIAITTQKGFKASDSITLLSNVMTKLEKPTGDMKKFLTELGVSTGETAIELFGFTGVLRKLVDAVNQGKLNVGDIFPDIRGRKQFGVFQQSIDDIERFSKSLADNQKTLDIYQKAIAIRGESPADLLVKETNKLKNAFSVDLGQSIINTAASLTRATGGMDGLKNTAQTLTDIIVGGGLGVGLAAIAVAVNTQTAAALAGSIANITYAGSIRALGAATALAGPVLAAFAAGFVTFKLAQRQLGGGGQEDVFGFDPSRIEATVVALQKLKDAATAINAKKAGATDPFASLDKQRAGGNDVFKDIISLTAKAAVANDKLLENIKTKTKDSADAIKLFFTNYIQTLSNGVSQLQKDVSKAQEQFEASAKFSLSYQEKSDQASYSLKLGFAQDASTGSDQKIRLVEDRIKQLTAKSDALYGKGTPESLAEARKINEELIGLLTEVAKDKAALQKVGFQASLAAGVIPHAEQGPDIFTPDFTDFNKRKAVNDARVAAQERTVRETQTRAKINGDLAIADLKANEAAFKQAIKEFESLSPLSPTGGVNKEFTTSGKFDQSKFSAELDKRSQKVLSTVSPDDRKAVELEVFKYKIELIKQAAAIETQKILETREATTLAEKDKFNARLDGIKKERQTAIDAQSQIADNFRDKPVELTGFANQLFAGGGKGVAGSEGKVTAAIQDVRRLGTEALDVNNALKVNGVLVFDPERVKAFEQAYERAVELITKLRDASGRNTALSQGELTPGGGIAVFQDQLKQLEVARGQIVGSFAKESGLENLFRITLSEPVAQLKKDFPELGSGATDAFKVINSAATDLANGGLEDLRKKFEQIRIESQGIQIPGAPAPALPGPNIGSSIGGDVTYAATGGIVGMFPGQPRGVDRYPIWAAQGERIISADTSRMYAPMLDAIMNRTAPRYMASGGIIESQSVVGDVTNNITVNGGATNAETGRVLANVMERLIRRNNIRLK